MRAKFSDTVVASAAGREMTSILRSCVHCGFCNATCPTYQLTGDELDGPRGRIYLIKSMLENAAISEDTQRHLDRCLTCRACETTCPSGVRYSRLLDLARPLVDEKVPRPVAMRFKRWLLRRVVPYPRRFKWLASLGRVVKPLVPRGLAELVPAPPRPYAEPAAKVSSRRMVLLEGCVQASAAPAINAAAREVFDRLDVTLESPAGAGCCGAVSYHLGNHAEALQCARRNIDAWSDAIEQGAEAVMSTSSGCTVMLKEYATMLAGDPDYAGRAARIADLVCDPAELIDPEALSAVCRVPDGSRIAFHAPCTLQHGLNGASGVERCLRSVGYELTDVADAHLCCGSAGTYSLLQPQLADALLESKLGALEHGEPDAYVSANIGCLMHLQRRATRPVMHWLEMIRPHLVGPR